MNHEAIDELLDCVRSGVDACDLESERLEFKQDPATVAQHRRSSRSGSALSEIAASAAICFANAGGGTIVIGVADRPGGPGALVGTESDADELRRKIFEKTTPHLTVAAHTHEFGGARFVVIEVAEGLTLYVDGRGRASRRHGSSCEPLVENERE